MSVIFAQYDATGIDIDVFNDCFHVLNDRGPDGQDCFIDQNVAIGCQHFFATSDSTKYNQPIDDERHVFAFDGRVDNRHTLERDYSIINSDMSDIEIFSALFREYNTTAFDKIIGPFFALVYNKDKQRLICGRDTMGLRYIFYSTKGRTVSVSSSPDAILANTNVQYTPDETAIAGYLSQKSKYSELSFYNGIDVVGRGSYIVLNNGALDERSYHTFTTQQQYSTARPDKFRQILERAIRARLEGESQPAISLSGGRDSNTIASIVVESLDLAPPTYSHVSTNDFGNERIQTEMENIDLMQDVFDLDSTRINIDEYDFKYDVCSSEYSFGLPVLDPYLHMQVQLYQEVSQRGTILLDGFGGNCFDGSGHHYYDLLTNGNLYQLVQRAYRDDGSMAAHLITSLLPLTTMLPSVNSKQRDPAWLTFEPASFDVDMEVTSLEQRFMLRFLLKHAKSVMRFQARQAALKHGVDLRFPLMDERLHREVLKMPPGSLQSDGRLKGLFLNAVKDVLPPQVAAFEVGMPFDPFLKQGLANYGTETIEHTFQTLHTNELGIVDEDAVRPAISNYTNGAEAKNIKPIHLWKLLTIEEWLHDYNRRTNLSIT